MESNGLTTFEREALQLSLASSGPYADALKRQLDRATVVKREESPVGVFVHLAVPKEAVDTSLLGLDSNFGDVVAEVAGVRNGLGFVVFVRNGALSMLEGYTFGDDRWPTSIESYRLRRS